MSLSRTAAVCAALVLVAPACSDENQVPAGWKAKHPDRSKWVTGTAEFDAKKPAELVIKKSGSELINAQKESSDLFTEAKYGDCTVEVEFLIPKESNSGVYLMGEYEVQIYDTFDKK